MLLRRFHWVVPYTILTVASCLVLQYFIFPAIFGPGRRGLELKDSHDLAQLVRDLDGEPSHILQSGQVPPMLVRNLPGDLAMLPVNEKVELFISLMLPQIIRANTDIRNTRKELFRILSKRNSFRRLSRDEQWWLNSLAQAYGCDSSNDVELTLRVDTIPVSLVLAQAIEESGWGTSRFARVGNAMYGQHLPEGGQGKFISSLHGSVKVAAFDSIYLATRSYLRNVNSSRAYGALRQIRGDLKSQGKQVTGYKLAAGLLHYSEKGEQYIRNIRYLIKRYDLEGFNNSRISWSQKVLAIRFPTLS
ncbi:glucosaminidase domain-containing protein [Desulfopila sp. IMCC35008]|uniref:glucosaminidase domain-containing protein n=1 Tax=Desulfopila sp. IMCC35008 TaxID=2653858 RepID=UPI0013D3C969|nr:glucosaminidase domain-containing protein [Desulfopila sp. IMCC35008]